ncbi:MAG: hypothetical protein R3E47_02285 [Paracoccaceae bacterium]
MLFDVQAALAEIMADDAATPATPATKGGNVAGVAEVAGGQAEISAPPSAPPASPSRQDYPPGAIVHLSRHRPKQNQNGKPVRVLPTHPATCAICGKADWLVGMTDMKGRTLHVRCWKAEGGMS